MSDGAAFPSRQGLHEQQAALDGSPVRAGGLHASKRGLGYLPKMDRISTSPMTLPALRLATSSLAPWCPAAAAMS